jgi:hypothetical protein
MLNRKMVCLQPTPETLIQPKKHCLPSSPFTPTRHTLLLLRLGGTRFLCNNFVHSRIRMNGPRIQIPPHLCK